MILSFKDKENQRLYETEKSRKFVPIFRAALRKLIQLDDAIIIEDLRVPPGNRLELLKDDRFGQSLRFWFGIQTNCDFRRLEAKEALLTAKVQPVHPVA